MSNQYGGMTVNERLYVSGLIDKFDLAVKEKKIDEVISILRQVNLDDKNIEVIIVSLGLTKIK
jgi:hypothetical protein